VSGVDLYPASVLGTVNTGFGNAGAQWTGNPFNPGCGSVNPAVEFGNDYGGVFATNDEISPYVGLWDSGNFSIGVGLIWPNPAGNQINNFGNGLMNSFVNGLNSLGSNSGAPITQPLFHGK
jgi:hypothetical protein